MNLHPVIHRALIGAGVLLGALLLGVQIARGAEAIPSVGITTPVNAADRVAGISGGLALRRDLTPSLMAEIGVAFRSEERFDGDVLLRQWPITASLWLEPWPLLYAGGGAGWYHTTLDYRESLPFSDEIKQQFGLHVGGGLRLPLAPQAAIDINGRYVFLGDLNAKSSTETMDPDFWNTSVGLAIRF